MALRSASAPIERVLRPEWREYGVSPTPTMQYLSLRPVTGGLLYSHRRRVAPAWVPGWLVSWITGQSTTRNSGIAQSS